MSSNCLGNLARTLAPGVSRRRLLGAVSAGVIGMSAATVRINGVEAKVKDKPKPKPKPKPGAGTCPTAHYCCNCYDEFANTFCTTAVGSAEECALLCNNATGGHYGFNDPAVISPGNDLVCGPENRCTVTRCRP
jgi:hypothetical protein